MARTFTAVYNPYSFDELVKPLTMYASEYRRQEDLMNKAYEEGVTEGTIAEGTKAYQIWEGINNNLREVADELATNGMNPQLNKRINSVARDYRMKSKTLTQANAAYQQERQRRLNAMDSHVFQNNSSLSIDDFLDGKTPESKSVNLQNLTKEVGTEAAQLASALYSSPDWNNIKTRLGGQVYSIVTPNGAPVDLIEASMYDDDAYNFVMANSTDEKFRENLSKFRDIYSNAMNRIDYTKYDSQDQLRLDEAIRLGMRAGMEQPKTETVSNKNFRTAQGRLNDARNNAAWNFQWLTERDENGNLLPDEVRLTRFGKLLRKTSLDELPEAINILRGDMSVVGPRPLLVEYLPWYSETEKHRHDVRPGLTGLAQVSGRNFVGWDKRLALDVEYVNSITFKNDLLIVCNTIKKFIKKQDIAVDTHSVESNFADERRTVLLSANGEQYEYIDFECRNAQ